jgi:hypothetical protein
MRYPYYEDVSTSDCGKMILHIPHLSAKPYCRVCAVTQLPNDLVARAEVLSDVNRIELIIGVMWKCFLFESFARLYTGSVETCQATPERLSY